MQATEASSLCAGADLHGNNVFLSLIDGSGQEVYRRRVKACLESVNEALEAYWPRIEAMGVEPLIQLQVRTLLGAVQDSERHVKEVEGSVRAYIGVSEAFERIQQVPGIGLILGMTIVLESGEFTRFAHKGCYASYCRAVQSRRESNGKKKGQNNGRNGAGLPEGRKVWRQPEPDFSAWRQRRGAPERATCERVFERTNA